MSSAHIHMVEFILYVRDQEKSTRFYSDLLRSLPVLHVKGMTEFNLSSVCKLGLMPNSGIARILTEAVPHPETGSGIPRCELYLKVDDVDAEFKHALRIGAAALSAPALRDWGDKVCYLTDPDGHVIAFAGR